VDADALVFGDRLRALTGVPNCADFAGVAA